MSNMKRPLWALALAVTHAAIAAACGGSNSGNPLAASGNTAAPTMSTAAPTTPTAADLALVRTPQGIHYFVHHPKSTVKVCHDGDPTVDYLDDRDDDLIVIEKNILVPNGTTRIVMATASNPGSKDLSDCESIHGTPETRGFANDPDPENLVGGQIVHWVTMWNIKESIYTPNKCWERVQVENSATYDKGPTVLPRGFEFRHVDVTCTDTVVPTPTPTPTPTPPPAAPTCAITSIQPALVGSTVTMASTADGNWTSDGSPTTGSGKSYSTSFASAGTHSVKVTNAGGTATCNVVVSVPKASCNVDISMKWNPPVGLSNPKFIETSVKVTPDDGKPVSVDLTISGFAGVVYHYSGSSGSTFMTQFEPDDFSEHIATATTATYTNANGATCKSQVATVRIARACNLLVTADANGFITAKNIGTFKCWGGGTHILAKYSGNVDPDMTWINVQDGYKARVRGHGGSFDYALGDIQPGDSATVQLVSSDGTPFTLTFWANATAENFQYNPDVFPWVGPILANIK